MFMDYIEWAIKNNIVNVIGNGSFAPDQIITRKQMAGISGKNGNLFDPHGTSTRAEISVVMFRGRNFLDILKIGT